MPDVPSIQRWSPKQVKNAITKCLFDNDNSFYAYLNRMAEDVQVFVENNKVEAITSYDLLKDKPTIQGIPLKDDMIDIFVDYKMQEVTPVVSDNAPDEETNKIWFDTNLPIDEVVTENINLRKTTYGYMNSSNQSYNGQIIINNDVLVAELIEEGEEVSSENQEVTLLHDLDLENIIVPEQEEVLLEHNNERILLN